MGEWSLISFRSDNSFCLSGFHLPFARCLVLQKILNGRFDRQALLHGQDLQVFQDPPFSWR